MLRRSLFVALVGGLCLGGVASGGLLRAAEEKKPATNGAADADAGTTDTGTKKKGKAGSKKSAASKKNADASTNGAAATTNGAATTTLTNGGLGGVAGAATFGLPGGIQAAANAAAANAAANAAAAGNGTTTTTTTGTSTGTSPFTADSSTTTGTGTTSNSTTGNGNASQNLTTLVDLTNQERRKQNLQELTVDDLLMKMARDHSANMAKQNVMSHELNGVTFKQRLDASGYKASMAGENIAAGQSTPAEAIAAWMKSPGHRANILNPDFTQIGVGIAKSSTGILYYTQDFGTPLNSLTTNPTTPTSE